MHPNVLKVLVPQHTIAARVAELGREIAQDYAVRQPLLVGTLSGAFIFMADLARCIDPVPDGLAVDFLRASSYGGTATVTSGEVKLGMQLKTPLNGRHVLLVEDIVDTGTTAKRLVEELRGQGAASVEVVALLNKSPRRTVDMDLRYCGFECPDEFVIGYGLDYNEMYRSLPYVGVLKPECYQ
ncbi:hypothetical protein WJX72_005309 [[Myrmecia] bisecta]|uniref:Hypoxanthine phosphoribosyltransferase n=1 Tax=[Myrmecia] bisecta TaxID=41462 RepID=A0AAW1R6H8_9CHLO